MFDQSFSAKNFRKIFDYENRRGVYLEGRFFEEIEKISQELKLQAKVIRERRKKGAQGDTKRYELELETLFEEQSKLKETKENLLMERLQKLSVEANDKSFRIELNQNIKLGGKNVYSAGKTAASYFALKQLQYNIRRLYKVKQSDRYQIVCQIREMLSDKIPKVVIRTDFSDFYESIPSDKLQKQIAEDSLLTKTSQKIVKRVLREYHNQSGDTHGVPRGVGLSAYLVELYMRRIDESLKSYSGVVYYSRYVDDVFIIYIPSPEHSFIDLCKFLAHQIKKYGLTRNRRKTKIQHSFGDKTYVLDYLGYKFNYGNGEVKLSLTEAKKQKYKERVTLAFTDYEKSKTKNEQEAKQLLIKRMRYLTSNTRLLNNKKNAAVGVYFTNSLITSTDGLSSIDRHLNGEIAKIGDMKLREYLKDFSFTKGFEKKRFRKFSVNELKQIVQVWKKHA